MIFDVSTGDLQPKVRMTASFASEAECNDLGNELARKMQYEKEGIRSFSICIPESAYDEKGIQSEKYD